MSGLEKHEYCKSCHGDGMRWTYDFYDGFERNRRWETCERCEGKGLEPKDETEEKELSDET